MSITDPPVQVTLSRDQLDEFDFDGFVESQYEALRTFMEEHGIDLAPGESIVDMGGGSGYLAKRVAVLHERVKVYETDPKAIDRCRAIGVEAHRVDALKPLISGDVRVVCFNLILHHLIGANETETEQIQESALMPWFGRHVFVHEYCYQSFFDSDLSGRLIWAITSSTALSAIGKMVAKFVPSLRANTFGVGVRFRSSQEWVRFFERRGFRVAGIIRGEPEDISLPRRLLFIKSIRRDSFLLLADRAQPSAP